MTSENCVICGSISVEYAAFPNGDVVPVCSDHVCQDGKIVPSFSDKQAIDAIKQAVRTYGSNSPYLHSLVNQLYCVLNDYKDPCYTCYTSM